MRHHLARGNLLKKLKKLKKRIEHASHLATSIVKSRIVQYPLCSLTTMTMLLVKQQGNVLEDDSANVDEDQPNDRKRGTVVADRMFQLQSMVKQLVE